MRVRRGLTIVELLLALVLASVVLAAMVGVVTVLTGADVVSAQRVEEETDLAVAQNLIRRTMVSLAAAAPMDPALTRSALEAARAGGQRETTTDSEQDAARAQEGLSPMAPPHIRPMFDIYYAELDGGSAAPVLECVVIDPPGALMPGVQPMTLGSFRNVAPGQTLEGVMLSRRISQSVRGVFEVAPMLDGGWAMQWRAVDPPAAPVVLIPHVSRVEWWALPIDEKSKDWRATMSSKLAEEFPIAVRLEVWTDNGKQLSWMFETEMQALTMSEPPAVLSPADEREDGGDGDEDTGDGDGDGGAGEDEGEGS